MLDALVRPVSRLRVLFTALLLLVALPAAGAQAAPVVGAAPIGGLATGVTHTCAVKTGGTVWCWGSNNFGELGRTGDEAPVPEQVAGVSGATAVVAGGAHTCALITGGTVTCWGQNVVGQLGLGAWTEESKPPTPVPGLSDVKSLTAGTFHTCAVKTDETVRCWGYNDSGQLGDGTKDERDAPVPVSGLTGVASVSGGVDHTCAVLTTGAVRCWGSGVAGKLGSATAESTVPIAVGGGLPAISSISAGYAHTCAVDTAGKAWCWGSGEDGRLGDSGTTDRNTPTLVSGLSGVERITAGGSHTCAVLSSGGVSCWGDGNSGQLGNGLTVSATTATPAIGVSGALSVSGGSVYTCALLGTGAISCWGDGAQGQLGNGVWSQTNAAKGPVTVHGIAVASAGTGVRNACAALTDGSLRCWGWGGDSQLGTGAPGGSSPTPTTLNAVPAGSITSVAVGFAHSCAVSSSGGGTVYCWGIGNSGQLGAGPGVRLAGPTQVPGLTGVTELSTSAFFTCARTSANGGEAWCWGTNASRQLGQGDALPAAEADAFSPVKVTGITGVKHVAAGDSHACAINGSDAVLCWGDGAGFKLGSTPNTTTGTPRPVTGLGAATAIGVGTAHSCALLVGGGVDCWGNDTSGQLGNGGAVNSGTRQTVSLGGAATQLGVGGYHACAVVTGGAVKCWGNNSLGQLGNGTLANATAPVDTTPALSGVSSLALGFGQSCAVAGSGTLSCWGDGYYGQVGDGPTCGHYGLTGLASYVVGFSTQQNVPPVRDASCDGPKKEDPPQEQPKQEQPIQPAPKTDPPTPGPNLPTPPKEEPKPAPVLRFSGGKLSLAAWIASPSGKACPKKVTVTVSSGKTKQTASVKAKKVVVAKKTKCALTATIKLKSSKLKQAKSLKVKASGKGVKTLSATVKAS